MEILKSLLIAYAVASMVFTTIFFIGLVRNIRQAWRDEQTIDKMKKTIKLVYVERVNNIHYMYDGLTNAFITQAATEEEMWRKAKLRFPDKEFIIKTATGNAAVVNVNIKGTE